MNARTPRRPQRLVIALFAMASALAVGNAPSAAAPPPAPWVPEPGAPFQIQLGDLPLDTTIEAPIYDVDYLATTDAEIATLQASGRRLICYLSAGSWESYRPDAEAFPARVLGKVLDGWPDERWLDVRALDVLLPIIEARMDVCRDRGFDAVDPDNLDGFSNDSGFPLTSADQLAYNRAIAAAAHARGLSVGLKNDVDQLPELLDHFDWALNESCVRYEECDRYAPFVGAGKAVFHIEYAGSIATSCAVTRELGGFSTVQKEQTLSAARQACPRSGAAADFDGDGTTDQAVFRPANGRWYTRGLSAAPAFGHRGDVPVPGSWDADPAADRAVYRPADGRWFVEGSSTGSAWGTATDIPVPGDYDGDGRLERAVFRPSNGRWYVDGQVGSIAFGATGDIPVPGDYVGGPAWERAVFRPSDGRWYTDGVPGSVVYGSKGDVPVPADYFGDDHLERAVFQPQTARWYTQGLPGAIAWGAAGDIPVPGDHDGNGRADRVVYRPSNGRWFRHGVTGWIPFGTTGDVPLPLSAASRRAAPSS